MPLKVNIVNGCSEVWRDADCFKPSTMIAMHTTGRIYLVCADNLLVRVDSDKPTVVNTCAFRGTQFREVKATLNVEL